MLSEFVVIIGKRAIQNLRVKCSSVDIGCNWVGTVGTLEEHVTKCDFILFPCPKRCTNDRNKVSLITRKDLDHHLKAVCPNRDYSCKHCGLVGQYVFITNQHYEECVKKLVTCPNKGCGKKVMRTAINRHLTVSCPCTVLPCKYKDLGCKKELFRRDLSAHEEDDKLHLHMAIDMTAQLFDINAKLLDMNSNLLNRIAAIEDEKPAPFTFKISELKSHRVHVSPCFYTSPKGYCMHIRVYILLDPMMTSLCV